jgi:hypothetical protein
MRGSIGAIAVAFLALSAAAAVEGQETADKYVLLATERTATMQKEITRASNDGFDLIAVAKTGEHIAILERRAP